MVIENKFLINFLKLFLVYPIQVEVSVMQIFSSVKEELSTVVSDQSQACSCFNSE